MRRYRTVIGVAIGLGVTAAVMLIISRAPDKDSSQNWRVLSDCDGQLHELVIHYVPEAAPAVTDTYRQFLSQLPADVVVHVVCPDTAAFDDLRGRLGQTRYRLSPVVVNHHITCWSRDRWLALTGCGYPDQLTLLSPQGEDGAELLPARKGDEAVAIDLAAALGGKVHSHRSELYFDGGDFVADSKTVFVTPAVLKRNFQITVETREELIRRLSDMLGRKVILLEDAPPHHAGMFMMAVGDGTVLIGDPSAARKVLEGFCGDIERIFPGDVLADFSPETQELFDAVARQCEATGYKVVRIPIVPGSDSRTYITYLNVIIDNRDGRRVVYMPVFSAAGMLNNSAALVWKELGYEVRTVDCSRCYGYFGSLRCLVNVLRRS